MNQANGIRKLAKLSQDPPAHPPLKSRARDKTAAPEAPAAPAVYVVEDDVSVRESLGNLMRSVGLNVELFGSAAEFLDHPRGATPGCLVLDVRLPGLSGLDLQKEMTARGDRTPIIFITGHADVPMSVRAMKGGAVEFLQKPFREQDLLDAIHLALSQVRATVPAVAVAASSAAAPLPPAAAPVASTAMDIGPRQAIARNIQMGRTIFSWSQEDLGQRCELHRTHISALEREELSVGVDTVDRVAAAFGVPPHALLMPPAEVQAVLLEAFNGTDKRKRHV
jgi:FixJ family two-component response regulator